jgi:hypothetical protein
VLLLLLLLAAWSTGRGAEAIAEELEMVEMKAPASELGPAEPPLELPETMSGRLVQFMYVFRGRGSSRRAGSQAQSEMREQRGKEGIDGSKEKDDAA